MVLSGLKCQGVTMVKLFLRKLADILINYVHYRWITRLNTITNERIKNGNK